MKFGSLFAGIGGIDLGLERAGMTCAWQVENNEFCNKVLNKHWPDVPKHGDIRDVGKENLETVDLIAGGFPCQPFSVAGKRRGTKDDRHLWPEMLRVISELKPAWILGENVPGIIPLFLDQAISDLEAEGYTCEAIVLPAIAFDAQHRRDRLFIVGYSQHTGRTPAKITKSVMERGNPRQAKPQSTRKSKGSSNEQSHLGFVSQKELQQNLADPKKLKKSRNNKHEISWKNKKPKRESRGNGLLGGGESAKWLPEPSVGRVVDGIPDRVDRVTSLGNAVVPQVAEFIGRIIMEANQET